MPHRSLAGAEPARERIAQLRLVVRRDALDLAEERAVVEEAHAARSGSECGAQLAHRLLRVLVHVGAHAHHNLAAAAETDFLAHKEWQKAIEALLKMGVRAEQQALAKWGLNFVIDEYLPRKLREANKFLP